MKDWYLKYFADTRNDPDPYIRESYKLFSPEQILLSLIVIATMTVLLIYFLKHREKQASIIKRTTIVMLVLEVLRYTWFFCYNGFVINKYFWNFSLCSMSVFVIGGAVLLIKKRGAYALACMNGILGGVAAMSYPLDVFDGYRVFHVIPVQSMFTHGMLLTIPLMLILSGIYRPEMKDALYAFIGTLGCSAVAKIAAHINDINYMFMLNADALGFLRGWTFFQYYPIIAVGYAAADVLTMWLCCKLSKRFANKEPLPVKQEATAS